MTSWKSFPRYGNWFWERERERGGQGDRERDRREKDGEREDGEREKKTSPLQYQLHSLTEALALVGGTVDVDLGADDVAKGHKHLSQLCVPELLGQMVDEQVAALGAWTSHTNRTLCLVTPSTSSTHFSLSLTTPPPPPPLSFSLSLSLVG